MEIPVQVSFRHIEYSAAVATAIRKRAAKLEKFFNRIIAMRVVIEPSGRRQRQGRLYHLRIDMTVPGGEIVVRRDPSLRQSHENIYVAIRDAFDVARRQLEDYVRIHFHGKQKHRELPMHGVVKHILADGEGGFLLTQDGRDIFFHRNSVLNDGFDRLKTGDEVRFSEEMGDKGPQATTVERVGKEGHHLLAA